MHDYHGDEDAFRRARLSVTFTPRGAITLTFIAFGVMVGAQIGAIPVLKVNAGVDALTFGILTSFGTAANILALAMGGWLNRHFDHRSVILFILPVAFVALVASLLVNSVFTFGLTVVLFSFCLGTLDIFMNAEAGVVEHEMKKPVFSSFHASVLYGIGLSGLGGGYIAVTYGAIWAALLAAPFLVLAMMAVNAAIPHRVEVHEDAPAPVALPHKILIIIGIVIGLDVAAELTCIQWSGQMLAEMQPTLAQFSGLGVAFYGLCNGTVRLFGDKLRARFDDITLIVVSLCIGVTGFAILATGPGFAISVAAFAVAGSGLGLIFPCLFSVAARLAPESRAAALSLVSAVSGPPRIFLPMLLGVLAQGYGLSAIYSAAGFACALAIGFTIWAGREMA